MTGGRLASRLKAGCGQNCPPHKLSALLFFMAANLLCAQVGREPIGVHDLSPSGTSPVKGRLPGACYYCHAPHSGIGGLTPLWNQKLSTQTYTTYTSTTFTDKSNPQPPQSSPSTLCLSCHDGTVAPGQTQAYGAIPGRAGDQLAKFASVQHGVASERRSIPGGVAGGFRHDSRQDRSGEAHQRQY